jgi:hypothetical protein
MPRSVSVITRLHGWVAPGGEVSKALCTRSAGVVAPTIAVAPTPTRGRRHAGADATRAPSIAGADDRGGADDHQKIPRTRDLQGVCALAAIH